jgi:hypothetical protein
VWASGLNISQPSAGGTATNVGVSIGGGIWWVVTGLIALVIGGYAAARLAGVTAAMDGVLHGLTTWAITMLVTVYLITTTVGNVVGGAFSLVGGVGQSLTKAVPSAQASGLSSQKIKSEVKKMLSKKPPAKPQKMSPQQAQAAVVKLVPQLL